MHQLFFRNHPRLPLRGAVILATVAEASTMPFAARRLRRAGLASPRRSSFVLCHFAGEVRYEVSGFLAKNNDSLAKEVEEHLLKSSKKVVASVCTPDTPTEPTGGAKPKGGRGKAQSSFASVGDKFVKSPRKEKPNNDTLAQCRFCTTRT